MLANELRQQYNRADSILVISSYPEEGIKYSAKVCAVGGYAKNTLLSLRKHFETAVDNRQIVVLTFKTDKQDLYVEDGILVWRIFERNRPLSYISLIKAVLKFNLINDILVEFEFASFGNVKATSILPVLLLILKLLGRKTILVLHQVVTNLLLLTGHLGWRKQSIKISIYNKLLQYFLFTLILPVESVVVLEETFKKRLASVVPFFRQKINVIPHGIDRSIKLPPKKDIGNKLQIQNEEFVLLYFGYLSWYKGVDFLIQTIVDQKGKIGGRKIRLIIAGGRSITQKTKLHYRQFVDHIYHLAKSSNIEITGFVKEGDIPKYFAEADLVILPYRVMMSSSGPLSFAATFGKPFILSEELRGYFESADFSNSLREANLKTADILFPLHSQKLIGKIQSVMQPKKLAKLARFSKLLASKRDFNLLAPSYARLLNDLQPLPSPVLSPALLDNSAA